jgi:hypothetical protein
MITPDRAADPAPAPGIGHATAPGAGLDAGYEQLRHAALHARAEAFPLGLAVLTGKGTTAWRHALTGLVATRPSPNTPGGTITPARSTPVAALPVHVSAELIDALAGLALAGT